MNTMKLIQLARYIFKDSPNHGPIDQVAKNEGTIIDECTSLSFSVDIDT